MVNAGTAAIIAEGDVFKLQNTLGPRWQANAKRLGNLAAINAIAALETQNGAVRFPSIQNEPAPCWAALWVRRPTWTAPLRPAPTR